MAQRLEELSGEPWFKVFILFQLLNDNKQYPDIQRGPLIAAQGLITGTFIIVFLIYLFICF